MFRVAEWTKHYVATARLGAEHEAPLQPSFQSPVSACLGYKPIEDWTKPGILTGSFLGMKLNAEDGPSVVCLDCFNDSVGRFRYDAQSFSQLTDGLMVTAVDRDLSRANQRR